jgi:hypothetical protein
MDRPSPENPAEKSQSPTAEDSVLETSHDPEAGPEQIKEAIDQARIEVLETSFSQLDSIESDIDRVKESAVKPSVKEAFVAKLESVRENIKDLAAQYSAHIKRFAAVSVIIAGGLSEQAASPDKHWDFERKQQPDGYSHVDSTTNSLIEELAREGVSEELSREDLLKIVLINDRINAEGVDSTEAAEKMKEISSASSYAELVEIAKEEGLVDDASEVHQYMKESLSYEIHQGEMKKERAEYEVIWEMHKQYGNPEVKTDSTIQAAQYNPDSNTIKIPSYLYGGDQTLDSSEYEDVKRAWLAELAHAKQFTGDRATANQLRWSDDVADMYRDAEKNDISLDRAHDEQYTSPGRIEYGAHQIIEPNLKEELENRIDMKADDAGE